MKAALNAQDTCQMMLAVATRIIAETDTLTDADLAIGDGDHGIGMRRGFEAVQEKLTKDSSESPEGVMKAVGLTIMSKTGGAAGAIFGTVFRSGASSLAGKSSINAWDFAEFLEAGSNAASKRGGAKLGQKTMLDALVPATQAAKKSAPEGLCATLNAAHVAALEGLENTRDLVATTGKARSLGERSLGHLDPGALSISFILHAMCEYACKN